MRLISASIIIQAEKVELENKLEEAKEEIRTMNQQFKVLITGTTK